MELYPPVAPTVLVVSGSPTRLALVDQALHRHFRVRSAAPGPRALRMAQEEQPDLILLGISEPGDCALESCRSLRTDPGTRQVPVVLLADELLCAQRRACLEWGAVDYVSHTVPPAILCSRVRAHLAVAQRDKTTRTHRDSVQFEMARQTRKLTALQDGVTLALAALVEARDEHTGQHLQRTQLYIRVLGNQLSSHPRFAQFLAGDMVETLFKCAPLHDIGKVGIPDRILFKPGRLESDEFEIMKTHPALGCDALGSVGEAGLQSTSFIAVARQIVYGHHERWDGSGYPLGLAGQDIPIPARLMALADVYDALISRRPYKDAMAHDAAARHIYEGRGRHFDPDVVDAFAATEHQFRQIAAQYGDPASPLPGETP